MTGNHPQQVRTILILLCMTGVALAQPAPEPLHGRVLDATGDAIAGATVELGGHAVVTDAYGRFDVAGQGDVTIVAKGFETVTLAARDGMVVRLQQSRGEVIDISGKAPEESKALEYTMSAKDIATTPGAMNDALRAITILPAAARIPFAFGGVVLRGMSPRDSSVFVDGVEIPLAFHFGGITGVFPTQVLDDMRVVPSGFDVSIGRTQGGVVELTSRRPRGDRYRGDGEVSLLHSQVSAEGPIAGGGAFLLGLRRSYFDVLVRPLISANDPLPSYTDGQMRAVWGEPAKRGQLTAYVIGSLDRIANSEDAAKPHDPESSGYAAANLGFIRAGTIYKRKLGPSLFTVAPMLGTNILTLYTKDYPDDSDTPQILDISRRWYLYGARGEWLRDDPGGFVRAGLDLEGGYLGRVGQYHADDTDDFPLPRNTVLWGDAAVFVETRRKWRDDHVSVRPGLRIERFGLGRQWAIDPRVNAHVTLSPVTTLRASLGRFHQPPSPAHFDEFADNLAAKSSYVDQGTLAVEFKPDEGLTASVTAFGHEGRRTLVDVTDKNIRPTNFGIEQTFQELLEDQIGLYGYQANIGRQRSYGLEAAIRYDQPRWRGLANFSWSRSKRRYDPMSGEHGWVPYALDQPLRLNLLAATSARRWNFGTRLTVVSGNPVKLTPAGTVYDPESPMPPPEVLQRLPTFWQLDVRVDRTWKKPWGETLLFFDFQNVTNHRNVEARESFPDEHNKFINNDTRGLPIIPYVGVEITYH